ncbi:MAG: ribonuclease E/G [Proteobacteria bacterium]|nr:ribonuclease E/G [Pseudomonadota bacterium]
MTVTIHAVSTPGEVRVAVSSGDELLDYALWRPGAPDSVGDLHRGRIAAVVPAMAGAFVALADAEGFLPDSEGAKGLTAGTILGVRVTRAAQGQKGPRLTAKLTAEEQAAVGTGSVGLVRRGRDPLHRLAARYPQAPVIADDSALAAGLRSTLGARLTLQPGATFNDDIAAAVDALAEPVVDLPNGSRLSIWPTPALVAIDVDSGAAAGGRHQHEAINRAVLPALAAQIRLRNLSGAIVVDLAGLSPRRRSALAPDLERVLASDPLHPRFLGFTALGLAEIVRPRVHPPLHELLNSPLAAALAALRGIIAGYHAAARLPVLRAAPPVVTALQGDPVALADLVRRTGHNLIVRSDPSLPNLAWVLEHDDG